MSVPERPVTLEVTGPERLDDLRAVWLALRDHHAEVEPGLGPVREDGDSWERARDGLAVSLSGDDAFLVLAGDGDGTTVGGAAVSMQPGSPTWTAPARYGELEVLAVLPGARGLGIGRLLVDAVQERLQSLGVSECRLSVTAGNLGAHAFYRELGFDTYALLLRRDAGAQGQDT